MSEAMVIAIWNKDDKVITRSVVINKDTKMLKLNGRKPDKIIVPESLTDRRLLRKVKDIGTYNCQVVKATGK